MDWRVLAIVVLATAGGSGAGSFLESKVSPQEAQLRELLSKDMELRLVHMEYAIRRDMPPEHTRQRIRAIERYLSKQDPAFQPPSLSWTKGGR